MIDPTTLISRVVRMDRAEIAWRTATAVRALGDRVRTGVTEPRWNRSALLPALSHAPDLGAVRESLTRGDWDAAHRGLAHHFSAAPVSFPAHPSVKPALVERILREHPQAAAQAAEGADRILAGEFDLLGYRGLRFDPRTDATTSMSASAAGAAAVDWHFDPVSNRRAPRLFWSNVPYLDPMCGDHKVIWELNRHQHWLTLGRAFWLTGDVKYRDRFVAELRSWLDENPPLVGINWASMLELGFRSISWLWALGLFADAAPAGGAAPWLVDLLIGLDRQLTHVEHNLSYYFSPNTHLIGEALALYVAGRALPQLAASDRRATVGRRILLDEASRQVAADGGHCERSTHYHRYTLDFYLLASIVARLTGDGAAETFEHTVARLASAARLLADERGVLPHLGDDDGGMLLPIAGRALDDVRDSLTIAAALVGRRDLQVGRPPEEALWMLAAVAVEPVVPARAPLPSAALPETGYYVSRSAAGDHLIIDGGPHGYGNCGHAHADALSMTLSVRGLPLLIDPGTASYTADAALRDRMRSTALHNTLVLDDRSQSVSRGPFHWTHVANARVMAWRTNDAFDYFDGAHDGYAPLEHRRRVLTLHGDLIVVADFVSGADGQAISAAAASAGGGPREHTAAVHWHIDPRWTVEAAGRAVTFTRGGERVGLVVPHGVVEAVVGDASSGLGWYSPAYGRVDRSTTVRIRHGAAAPFWMMSVFDLNPQNPVATVESVPVWAEAGTTAHAASLRITRAASVDYVLLVEPAAAHGATWRVGDFETDARVLFCRVTGDRPVARIALVDGSLVRTAGRRGIQLVLPGMVPDLHVDFSADARGGIVPAPAALTPPW